MERTRMVRANHTFRRGRAVVRLEKRVRIRWDTLSDHLAGCLCSRRLLGPWPLVAEFRSSVRQPFAGHTPATIGGVLYVGFGVHPCRLSGLRLERTTVDARTQRAAPQRVPRRCVMRITHGVRGCWRAAHRPHHASPREAVERVTVVNRLRLEIAGLLAERRLVYLNEGLSRRGVLHVLRQRLHRDGRTHHISIFGSARRIQRLEACHDDRDRIPQTAVAYHRPRRPASRVRGPPGLMR